jgi:hypothetical protein
MPQQSAKQSASGSKKKKGKVPAHQNSFAFIHNVKSKMTDKILDSPNTHVCRRCHEKIEWRKQYRKYKVRTIPGKCNLCSVKRIKAAYHTICEPCSRKSTKAVSMLAEMNQEKQRKVEKYNEDDALDEMEIAVDKIKIADQGADKVKNEEEEEEAPEPEGDVDQAGAGAGGEDEDPSTVQEHYRRVCCICVKEPALLDGDEVYDDGEDPFNAGGRRLKLRERKTIERRQLQESKPKRKSKHADEDDDDEDNSNDEDPEDSDGSEPDEENDNDDDHAEDPFLQAVGGADKLLVGDAYQAMLLQRAAEAEASANNASAESK